MLLEDELTDANNQMTPQTEYTIKIEALDNNGYSDIENITVYIYYDADGSGDDEPSSDNPQTQATYRWTGSVWTFVGPIWSTWGIDASESRGPVDTTYTTGTWYLHFIPGKVATESDSTVAKWIIKVVVVDNSSASDSLKDIDNEMLWYGEISILDTSFSFGAVALGSSDNPITEPVDGKIDVVTVCNVEHKIQAKTDAQWSSGGYTVNVSTTSENPGPGEIALENNAKNNENTASLVTTAFTTVKGLESLSATDESGLASGIYVWLSVGTELPAKTYQGTYYVTIMNL
ncbi:hypothetical protein Asulf_02058 [Archaeoglobus sulfaticallidus PM70-1]|uniref:Uncharacterized protein n=1 Tax=Archaeoglobus sulfaticallidus PM70-1 TaxID=387631 RepID=N0BGB4_9EURY|nr:hypothetical protein [Archaeoglobus sulfaticallidus]AGK62018.1 hypothetical protein Asulf_02058 [Archaeoglobus sulfaticallidus PM70-1]